jgi:hypothetical protein
VVTGRPFKAGFRPILRQDGRGRERKKHGSGGDFEGAWHG